MSDADDVRAIFMARAPLETMRFCRDIGASKEVEPLLGLIREAMADLCQIPNDSIYASDTWQDLNAMMHLGWDPVEFIMKIESKLETRFTDEECYLFPGLVPSGFFFWRSPAVEPFGMWAFQMANRIQEHQNGTAT